MWQINQPQVHERRDTLRSRALATLQRAACRGAMIAAASAIYISAAPAQLPIAPAATPANLPSPIYWKQNLFLIPYQWSSAAEPSTAQLVTLYVSKDQGVNWQKISEAKPQVKAFNYRAEGDGEYWFAVRTIDNLGHSSPFGPFQPELRVIVDTTIPRIEELRAWTTENDAINIQCRATDSNLDPTSLRVEAQLAATSAWQPISLQSAPAPPSPTPTIEGRWQPPAGIRPLAIRATISDRAGNSAVYQTPVAAAPPMSGPSLSQPGLGAAGANPLPAQGAQSWPGGSVLPVQPALPVQQSWPAGAVAAAPLQLWTSGKTSADDGVTAYGNPTISVPAPIQRSTSSPIATDTSDAQSRVPAQFADAVKSSASGWTSLSNVAPSGPSFTPLEPFRQTSTGAAPATAAAPALVPNLQRPPASAPPITPVDSPPSPTHKPATPPKLVGSRTFALEYDLDDAGGDGVSRVELWGTRDGGQNWNRYTVDDDNRSPLVVTVDNEGLYGFKILVQSASGAPISPPHTGDEPELWVSVDLHRPTVELTSIERGEGNLADHLILHWRAQDNNLESRPIALFFSSRPTGPWSAIATNLENTGEYAWRVERYVPSRVYLRVEARDTAGNLAAFQTREPVEFDAVRANAKLRAPTSTGSAVSRPNTAH